jgi:chemotaxis protein methyltransferase WspC
VAFCRNVLIYFHADARRMAVRHLDRLLSSDGFLCSAPAEARVFSEAGFGSLGSECPFAFRRQDSPAAVPASERMQAKSQPLAGSDGTLASPPPPRAAIPWAPSGPPGRRDAGEHAAVFAANATRVEMSGKAILHAAQQAADSGILQEADELCGQALASDPEHAEAHYLRGVVRQAQGMFIEAQRSLEKALYLDPRHYQALVHMTLLAQQRGDRLAAANYHRRAEQVTPREAE